MIFSEVIYWNWYYWVTSVPAHVNINTVEVMPICQAWGLLSISLDMNELSNVKPL